jgi:hypothetical protein
VKQRVNVGGAANRDAVFALSRGELFKWASHNDLYDPRLLALCVDRLDTCPDVVLTHACRDASTATAPW